MAFLEVSNIVKDFGGLVANNNISFTIEKGEIVGLIGPNGAGKTTLFNCIVGFYRPDSGQINFNDKNITGLRPFQTNRAGIGRTFQVMKVTTGLSAIENVMVGAFCRTDSRHVAMKEASEILDFLGLKDIKGYHLNELPIAIQRKIGLARALATKPELLMLDEVASGLNHTETDELVVTLKRLNEERGITLFLIEHIMEMVMSVSHRVVVLDYGEKIAEGLPAEIVKNEDVIKAYLGEKYAKSH
ncbi:MAG TPA: ABC transporter ATP-binding protein [Syntrophorhabdaceae bacterium]|nr:ABC transporter ATP-binding protein [Syntrophorhabdaceae bacterium]MDI9561691.1 ABC transporter ATP-binding protein [Pseudomonadota bacterium]OQC49029.1 MAG: Methionine import ATP-binding protein MetN 2 [Deltaproteobacteria bacterium ADurb.Bin026]MBP8698821.1 ABC transporter ATP-binding protein [Syntrophorhabdaceae bacterium]MBV6506655.1 Methionine import ATP-binding protein MetN 2 [Syntrophorhabdaceae bacterium]